MYIESLDLIIQAITNHFDQPGYRVSMTLQSIHDVRECLQQFSGAEQTLLRPPGPRHKEQEQFCTTQRILKYSTSKHMAIRTIP